MTFDRGSEWRKWDLHVHTPCSLVQEYGGDTPEAWDKFIRAIEQLPSEFSVIGINDYLFIDGYKKVLEAKRAGRMSNIDLFLPVIELRIDKFGGSDSNLTRANYHVIFSEEIDPIIIEQQFLNAIYIRYKLSPEPSEKKLDWSGVITKQSLEDLGRQIISSLPEDKKNQYSSPLKEGFNHINFSLDRINEIIQGHYFHGKVLTALGKAEWDKIRWNEQSVADKKHIINDVDFVFISSENPTAHANAKAKLTLSRVNDRLLDCSDAHRFPDSKDKDRIGKCFTWLKADPTFRGLKQIIHESADRIFVGDIPEPLINSRNHPTKFVKQLVINKVANAKLDEPWFDGVALPFNTGLVAIIGNKGSGKSALVDIVGLLGDSRHQKNASFLNDRRFNPRNNPKGTHFEATLTWCDDLAEARRLDSIVDGAAVARVKYIPQNFFEKVCNDIASGTADSFHAEIKEVIFSHVPIASRLGQPTLDDLIHFRTGEIERSINSFRIRMTEINRDLIKLQAMATDEFRNGLSRQKESKLVELAAHDARKPKEVSKPSSEGDEAVISLIELSRDDLLKTDTEISNFSNEYKQITLQIHHLTQAKDKINHLNQVIEEHIDDISKPLLLIGMSIDQFLTFDISVDLLEQKYLELLSRQEQVQWYLSEQNHDGLPLKRKGILAKLDVLQESLAKPGREYEEYLDALREWIEARTRILGDSDTPETLEYINAQIDRQSDLPLQIAELRQARLLLVRDIYQKLLELKAVYEELYKPVQDFIAVHSIAQEKFRLNFDVSIVESGFVSSFLMFINQGASGTFFGTEPGTDRLRSLLALHSFNSEQGVVDFVTAVEKYLEGDCRKDPPPPMSLSSQMRKSVKPETCLDYLFGLEYLEPEYQLQMTGRSLDQLSPGEKGSLLLVFYLLVDRNDSPLLIDQPEENLDNQTIFSLLVPSIKLAKTQRQIFVVTHNANIAVVCDAEQVVYAHHEPGTKKISYTAGAIEHPSINTKLMDILEGTEPAFDNRKAKYGKA